jgi:2-keto-4-pentenoate hydratase
MTGAREETLLKTVEMLLDARRNGAPIADLPADLQPADVDEAYFVQDRMAETYGEIGGWKI